jgi:dTMP kinase
MSGLFITFEGGDGVGKTTQAEALRDAMEADGREVLRTREPGGTPLGAQIRELLLHTRGGMDPRAEALLFAADRAQNIAMQVRPALERGTHVIQDRYIDSSVAYQGAGRSIGAEAVAKLSAWASDSLTPDLTVLLDLTPDAAQARVAAQSKGYDRMEAEGRAFRERLRDGFLAIAETDPERFLVIDASADPADITATVYAEVRRRLALRIV